MFFDLNQISFKSECLERGTIALIGPTRMDYDRVIEAVNYVSQKINELLEGDDL